MKKIISLFIGLMLISSVSFGASIVATWNANSESDLAGYNIFDKVGSGTSTKIGSVGVMTNPTFTITNVVDGVHTVTVTAFDASGNESLPSDPVSATVDTTAPGVPTKPTVTVSGSTVRLTWTAVTASDLAGYGIYNNGTLIGSIGVMTSPTFTTTLGEGSHSLTIDSFDSNGNRSAKSEAVIITIDTTAPIKPSSLKINVTK